MRTPIFIYGAGGLGIEILSFLKGSDFWEPAGFIDDNIPPRTAVKGLHVIGSLEAISELPKPANVILAIGDPVVRQSLWIRMKDQSGIQFPFLVHPTAILQDKEWIRIGAGSIITAGCILTTDIQIGENVLLNLNCTVGHDTIIGDHSSIMPGVNLAGHVRIGEAVLMGSGANILNGITIGSRSKVGAGAVVTRDVPADVVVMGVPAKIR